MDLLEQMQSYGQSTPVYSVHELNELVRTLLETQVSSVWVSGEISNFICPASGHWYFSLKDEQAQIRCVMFRGAQQGLRFRPENGMKVLAQAKASLYGPRGDYQLIVRALEETGFGAMQRAFEQLKQRLAAEGLFAASRKRPLPRFPRTIGIITSDTGAAIRDILTVLQRRCPLILVILYPSLVQGKEAADALVAALSTANRRQECDLLIIGRGGGSLEDLWPFNEEKVARAIVASQIPIVSAVGHEIDVTISDFVADVRAPTPSAAAELVSPNSQDLLKSLQDGEVLRRRYIQNFLQQQLQRVLHAQVRLPHPLQRIREWIQTLDHFEVRRQSALRSVLEKSRYRFQSWVGRLEAISPLATLARGYSLVFDESRHVVSRVSDTHIDQVLSLHLSDGSVECRVIEINNEEPRE